MFKFLDALSKAMEDQRKINESNPSRRDAPTVRGTLVKSAAAAYVGYKAGKKIGSL